MSLNISEKKSIAVVYRGIYHNKYSKSLDFNQNILNNHIQNIFQYYDCEIYIYTTSFSVSKDMELINVFQNNNLKVIDFKFQESIPDGDKNYVKSKDVSGGIQYSLEMIKKKYNTVISLRFDLLFLKPINTFDIKYDKFYIGHKCEEKYWLKHKFVSDFFFIIPYRYLTNFINVLKIQNASKKGNLKCRYHSSHGIYKNLISEIGDNAIKFLVDGMIPSNTDKGYNGFIKILRKNCDLCEKYESHRYCKKNGEFILPERKRI